jgi:hypothetical protein
MSVLSEQEKVSVRHHLGYLNVQEVATFALGTPAGVETQFIIEGAMNRMLPSALPLLRKHLQNLECIEEAMIKGIENTGLLELGEIKFNQTGKDKHQSQLRQQYNYWANSLANVLGVSRNPYDKRTSSSGINVRVVS